MKIYFKRNKGTLIAYLVGELDHHAVKVINSQIDLQILSGATKNLILNMSQMPFMDSSGIAMILGRFKKISALGGRCAVVELNKQSRKILEMTHIKDVVSFFDDEQQALKHLSI